jgi:hypothetical protein
MTLKDVHLCTGIAEDLSKRLLRRVTFHAGAREVCGPVARFGVMR